MPEDPTMHERDQHLDEDVVVLLALGETVDADGVDTHLRACGHCQSRIDQFRSVVAAGRGATPADRPVQPPPTVWEGVAAQMRADRGVTALRPAGARRSTIRTRTAVVLATAAAVVAAAAVVLVDVGGDDRAPQVVAGASLTPSPNGSSRVLDVPLDPIAPATASGAAVMVATSQGSSMKVEVPDLPTADGFYEVWLMDGQDKLVSLGPLDARNEGTFVVPGGLEVSEFPILDVSLEPFDGDPTHSGTSVVRGVLPA
jgi:anti-sigma-K factor RskA